MSLCTVSRNLRQVQSLPFVLRGVRQYTDEHDGEQIELHRNSTLKALGKKDQVKEWVSRMAEYKVTDFSLGDDSTILNREESITLKRREYLQDDCRVISSILPYWQQLFALL